MLKKLLCLALLAVISCAQQKKNIHSHCYSALNQNYCVLKSKSGFKETGVASWYGKQFHGKKMANGKRFNMYAVTAAHRTLPLGTKIKVTNLKNRKSIVVTVTDRGPFAKNRVLDLSYKAAKKLGYDKNGTTKVTIKAL